MNTVMYELALKNATYEIAQTLDLAWEVYEDGFDGPTQEYRKSLAQAVDEACREQRCNQPRLIFLLLQNCWDDAIDWARDVIAAEDGP